ncbi:MAG: hypothetical protein HY242_05740 [Afipia sp.]|nr:hypothetical protein [Afipia sp.]
MAEQAFALSPMTASASLPTQADYDAIAGAFMETARGRWFLAEYARRNRNADTTMVLEAVARIEQQLAAQKQPAVPNPAPDLIPAVTAILNAARQAAETALTKPDLNNPLAPARKCAVMIREISWGLRESGADNRVCGLLDAQVEAIDAACDGFSTDDLRGGVLSAFDHAAAQIAELANNAPQPAAQTAVAPAQPAPAEKPRIVPVKQEATVVRLETPQSAPVQKPAPKSIAESSLHASIGGSLGASLLVSGLVQKPHAPKKDPLAPLRRMTSAEKIAFFS